MGYRNTLRAFQFASTGIGAVAESQFIHLLDHCAGALGSLNLTLGQESQRTHTGCDEEHCRSVLAGCHTGATSDTGRCIHAFLSHIMADKDIVGILG